MIHIIYSQSAEDDLINIYLYSIDNFGENHALEYELGLKRRLAQLLANPRLGVEIPESEMNIRKLVFRAHVIYYSVVGDNLIVRRILDGRQDPLRHL